MKNKIIQFLILFCGLIVTSAKSQVEPVKDQPNIIFILTDDLGYGDLGVLYQNQRKNQGKPNHQTPNLDQLAREGMILTRHYAPAPVCAPSRASLMLGKHQGHAEIRDNQFDKALPDNHTIASILKEAGYQTGLIGKWGLQGIEGNSPETWEAYPTKRGFDYFFGYVRHGDGHNHYPAHKSKKDNPVELYEGKTEISSKLKGSYTTDLFTAVAKEWIINQNEKKPKKPFFLELSYDTPHAALQVAASPYPEGGGLNGGVKVLRETNKFINTSEESIDDYFHPDYAKKDWPVEQKRFASMVRRIDNGVGDLVRLLKDLNIDENTLLVFTSDNGPHKESYGFGPYKPTFFDNYGPLDGIKRDTWEGGIRVPTLVRWPETISAHGTNSTPSSFYDWMPTFAELSGVPAPATTDGKSLMPVLTGKGKHENLLYIEYLNNSKTPDYHEFDKSRRKQTRGQMQVIYLDGYKGIRTNIQSADDNFSIYDTEKDSGETVNLANSSHNKVDYFKKLQEKMKERVLQVRRSNNSAPRPYDSIPVPPVKSKEVIKPGLYYHIYNVKTPWVPSVYSLDSNLLLKKGVGKNFKIDWDENDSDIVIEYTGFLEVPETGEYTFKMGTSQKAVFRLHGALYIDADKGYSSGKIKSSTAFLEKGLHPLKLTYSGTAQELQNLKMEWNGPSFNDEPIHPSSLFYSPEN